MNIDTDRLWTAEEIARFLGIPKATLYQWHYLRTGPSLAAWDGISGTTPVTSSAGSASSKRQDEHLRSLAQGASGTWSGVMPRAQ